MIYFSDKNTPTYKAHKKLREQSFLLVDACDVKRLEFVNNFLIEYEKEYDDEPAQVIIERLGNFLLRPYIGDKSTEYLILSSYSLDRRQANEACYYEEKRY